MWSNWLIEEYGKSIFIVLYYLCPCIELSKVLTRRTGMEATSWFKDNYYSGSGFSKFCLESESALPSHSWSQTLSVFGQGAVIFASRNWLGQASISGTSKGRRSTASTGVRLTGMKPGSYDRVPTEFTDHGTSIVSNIRRALWGVKFVSWLVGEVILNARSSFYHLIEIDGY